MRLMRSMTILMMVGWGMMLTAASTPQIDPEILDVLQKVESKINSSDYLSYHVERKQTQVDSDRKPWVTSGTVWLQRVPSDTFFGAYFHLQGKDDNGTFDYFYDGNDSRVSRDKFQKVTIYRPADFPDTPNHPAKARSSTVIFRPLLFDVNFSDFVLENCSSATLEEEDGKAYWILVIKDDENEYGMKITCTYTIHKHSYRIARIKRINLWRGTTTKVVFELSDYLDDKKTVAEHISMPDGFKPEYAREVFQRKKSTKRATFEHLIGKTAPDFKLTSIKGDSVSLSALHGRIVLLEFWEHWCGHCIVGIPDVNELAKKLKGKVVVMGLVSESRKVVEKIVSDNHLVFPTLWANKTVLENYHINARPTYFLIDKDGKVVEALAGDLEGIEIAIEKLLNEEDTDSPQPASDHVE